MQQRAKLCVFIFIPGILTAVFAYQEKASNRQLQSNAPILWQPSMNLFRRFSAEPSAMYEFYGKVPGLKQLSTFNWAAIPAERQPLSVPSPIFTGERPPSGKSASQQEQGYSTTRRKMG
jgi:hypothetical protein